MEAASLRFLLGVGIGIKKRSPEQHFCVLSSIILVLCPINFDESRVARSPTSILGIATMCGY
ncbi:MAG: hypothetical protein QNJ63_16520 [Calothrix sp. MO_192.B10]|nr:hypothetical protein [Calothrix sp. MO_192.B10]